MSRRLMKILFIIYIAVLVVFIVIKPHLGWAYFGERIRSICRLRKAGIWNLSLRPFIFNQQAKVTILNIIAFVPLGVFLGIFNYSPLKALIISLLITFCIELFQFISCLGYGDVDDIILNMLGAAIGYLIFRLLKLFYKFIASFFRAKL